MEEYNYKISIKKIKIKSGEKIRNGIVHLIYFYITIFLIGTVGVISFLLYTSQLKNFIISLSTISAHPLVLLSKIIYIGIAIPLIYSIFLLLKTLSEILYHICKDLGKDIIDKYCYNADIVFGDGKVIHTYITGRDMDVNTAAQTILDNSQDDIHRYIIKIKNKDSHIL